MSYAITYFADGVYTFTNGVWKEIKVLIITTILNSNERKYIEKYKNKNSAKERKKRNLGSKHVSFDSHPFCFLLFGPVTSVYRSLHPSIHTTFFISFGPAN